MHRGRPEGARNRPAAETREQILDAAHDLFYWHGIRATGIDRVAEEAGVAPTTLYRLFESKDGLVAAYVERAAAEHREWFEASLGEVDRPTRKRVLDLFKAQEREVEPDRCRGCPFMMALAEIPDEEHPAHREAVAVKAWVRARFRELAGEIVGAGSAGARELGDQLALVFDGAYASAQSLQADAPTASARAVAQALIGQSHR
jgi:AcrR family transcriptional regulator